MSRYASVCPLLKARLATKQTLRSGNRANKCSVWIDVIICCAQVAEAAETNTPGLMKPLCCVLGQHILWVKWANVRSNTWRMSAESSCGRVTAVEGT